MSASKLAVAFTAGPGGVGYRRREPPSSHPRAAYPAPVTTIARRPSRTPDSEEPLYIQGRGALRRELILCLRTGRALRVPRARSHRTSWAHVTPDVLISERPAEAEDRAVPGHWEGDLLIGLERSAIGTVVERSTRYTKLVHLPQEEGYEFGKTIKNGPALAGYGAITMTNALSAAMADLPAELARSVTWDRGKEMSAHARFTIDTGIPVFFADPHSP